MHLVFQNSFFMGDTLIKNTLIAKWAQILPKHYIIDVFQAACKAKTLN